MRRPFGRPITLLNHYAEKKDLFLITELAVAGKHGKKVMPEERPALDNAASNRVAATCSAYLKHAGPRAVAPQRVNSIT